MDKQEVKICVKPYYHDVVNVITRKPKFNKTKRRHYIRFKGKNIDLNKAGGEFVMWVDEDDRDYYSD